jgi:hypothetical protein
MIDNGITKNWAKFHPHSYLEEYYLDVGPENFAQLQFTVNAFYSIPQGGLLDFGCGPTITGAIPAVNHAREIHLCDYLDENFKEVQLWLDGDPSAFDWSEFIKVTLDLENRLYPNVQTIAQREAAIRQRVTQIFKCDASKMPPIDSALDYDIVVSNYCIDSATDDYRQWRRFFHNLVSMLKPGGTLLLSALKGARYYRAGEHRFPTVYIQECDLKQALIEEDFDVQSIQMECVPADRPSRTYEGIMMVMARKRGPGTS